MDQKDIMKPTIELSTGRLHLRPIQLSDARELWSYRSDRVANRYQGWIPGSIEDAEQFISERVSPVLNVNGTWFQFAVILRANGRMIGDIGLHFFDNANRQVELGCTLGTGYQGCGYATEALMEVIRYLFGTLDKHRLIASIDPENLKSIHLFERLGFRKEGHFRKCRLQDGQWIDDLIFALLREEMAP